MRLGGSVKELLHTAQGAVSFWQVQTQPVHLVHNGRGMLMQICVPGKPDSCNDLM